MRKLYYKTAPAEWMEGLPIGNGRLACMVWGDNEDRFTLNHEWLWKGKNRVRSAPKSAYGLPLVRKYIKEGDHFKATALANLLFGGYGGISQLPQNVDSYQPAGELQMQIDNSVFQSRELDIFSGTVTVCRSCNESMVRTAVFADCNDGCISIRWNSESKFSGKLCLMREAEEGTTLTFTAGKNTLRMDGNIINGIQFAVLVQIDTDGQLHMEKEQAIIQDATYVQCAVNMATDREDLEAELTSHTHDLSNWESVREAHIAKFSRLMERVDFCLKDDNCNENLLTEERIHNVKNGMTDNGISQLYFNFGRYLLISSSICGQLPANLQGKWNDSLTPPWNCDYHFDINLQMNYWMAEPAGMTECMDAFIRYVRSFIPSGKEAARNMFDCRGIFLPLQSDAWGNATPESYGWAVWIGSAPWIARHLWDHYRYTGNVTYLKEQAYEFFKLVAEFYEDYLQKDEQGVYQILPSQSPENPIEAIGHFPVLIDQSTAMDVQLCYDSLGYAIQTAEILGVDTEQAEKWKEMRSNLPPFAIGSDGRLMEWQKEYPEKEPGHRHWSHLYGMYPSDLFTPNTRPEQYQAGLRSMQYRLSHGGGHTGWSRAWTSCLAARTGDKQGFYQHYTALIQDFATVSLLDLHPPRIFQIDGNLGAVAAVIESVVSYYDDTAHLLNGLPDEWSDGHLNGIRIPGGHILDVSWKNGKLEKVMVTIGFSGKAVLAWDGVSHTISGKPGEKIACF